VEIFLTAILEKEPNADVSAMDIIIL